MTVERPRPGDAVSGLIGIDTTPLCSGHAIRGIGRYVGGILDALLTTHPGWCREHLGVLQTRAQEAPPGVRVVWRTRRATYRPQDVGWIVAALADRATVRRSRADLWHETDPGHPFGPDDVARALVTAYDLIPLLEPAVMTRMRPHRRVAYRWYLQRLRSARQILAISNTTAMDLQAALGVPSDRVHVVYPAIVGFGPASQGVSMTPSVVFVGVPDPHKRPDLAVAAFKVYRRMGGKKRLVFVGHHAPATRQWLQSLADSAGVARDVEFRDRADDRTLASLYAHGVLLALSTREGFGLPPVECLLSGGRVVATSSPIYHEVLANAATFSRDDSPDAIGESLLATEAAPFPVRAVADLARRYSPEVIASELIRVYESILL